MSEVVRAVESRHPAAPPSAPPAQPQASLVDLLDRLLAKGVVVAGEVTLSIADVDLVHVSLRALITSVRVSTPPEGAKGATRGGAA
jgi:Gas vesicle protein